MEIKLTIIQEGASANKTYDFESWNHLMEFVEPKVEVKVVEERGNVAVRKTTKRTTRKEAKNK